MPQGPITVAIVGAGQRGAIYAEYCRTHPTEAKVVAVCEPRPGRLAKVADSNSVPEAGRYQDWKALIAVGKRVADAVAIAVLDGEHAEVVKAFAEQGYAILCEKPIATSIDDCLEIISHVEKHNVIFGCGHVLRYSPFNRAVKDVIQSGVLGDIENIQHIEPVGQQHFAHSFVRGNWRNQKDTTFSLMAKSCHDIDIINFYMSDSKQPRALSSFGSLSHFKPSKKPAEAGDAKYCVDCAYEPECPYSAKKIYLAPVERQQLKRSVDGGDIWAVHIVDAVPDIENVADAISPRPKTQGVRTDADGNGRWGKCVYSGDNDVVDQQVVNIQFEDGTTAGFTMVAFTKKICERETHIHGSHGELVGDMETFTVTDFRTNETKKYTPDSEGGGHGGGDSGLMRAFIRAVATGNQLELGVTPQDILRSHLMVFAAEKARLSDQVIPYAAFQKELVSN